MTMELTEAQIEAQDEIDRRYADQEQALRGLFEWIGLPLICVHGACRRSRLCTQERCPTVAGSRASTIIGRRCASSCTARTGS